MSAADSSEFRLSSFGWLLLARALPALGAIAAAADGRRGIAAALLVLAAAADLLVDSLAQRHAQRQRWQRGTTEIQIEGFIDFLCFVWAPVAFVWSQPRPLWLWLPAAVFALAGAVRLARFNVEGPIGAGYRGLPVTYNALLLPLADFVTVPLGPGVAAAGLALILVVAAALMLSRRLIVPRISL